jgi:hypothetical protein
MSDSTTFPELTWVRSGPRELDQALQKRPHSFAAHIPVQPILILGINEAVYTS